MIFTFHIDESSKIAQSGQKISNLANLEPLEFESILAAVGRPNASNEAIIYAFEANEKYVASYLIQKLAIPTY